MGAAGGGWEKEMRAERASGACEAQEPGLHTQPRTKYAALIARAQMSGATRNTISQGMFAKKQHLGAPRDRNRTASHHGARPGARAPLPRR